MRSAEWGVRRRAWSIELTRCVEPPGCREPANWDGISARPRRGRAQKRSDADVVPRSSSPARGSVETGFSSNRSDGCDALVAGSRFTAATGRVLKRIWADSPSTRRAASATAGRKRCCIHESRKGFSTPIVTWSSVISIEAVPSNQWSNVCDPTSSLTSSSISRSCETDGCASAVALGCILPPPMSAPLPAA